MYCLLVTQFVIFVIQKPKRTKTMTHFLLCPAFREPCRCPLSTPALSWAPPDPPHRGFCSSRWSPLCLNLPEPCRYLSIDLCKINQAIIPIYPVGTNPYPFSHIFPLTLYFTVLDQKILSLLYPYTTPHSPYLPSPGRIQTQINVNN